MHNVDSMMNPSIDPLAFLFPKIVIPLHVFLVKATEQAEAEARAKPNLQYTMSIPTPTYLT
jgi:hypothetical protein